MARNLQASGVGESGSFAFGIWSVLDTASATDVISTNYAKSATGRSSPDDSTTGIRKPAASETTSVASAR